MNFYPQNDQPLTEERFQNPTVEYRGAPFWAWNHHLDEDTIRLEVRIFKEMGMGGYHAHVRTGLDTPYLSEDFMQHMAIALDEAKRQGLLHWLYDEDRWPSGPAGGKVTENTQYAQKKLIFTAFPKVSAEAFEKEQSLLHGHFYEMARFQVHLEDGYLADYKRVRPEAEADWYAYLCLEPKQAWWNDQSYVDTLKKEAIQTFLNVTHETYAKAFGDDFGGQIPAIFTDEPQFAKKQTLTLCNEKQEISIPFTDDLEETYASAYDESLLDHLPEIFWEKKDGTVSKTRYHYHDHVCERFVDAFADTVGAWCKAHNLLLTGHMMEEPTLASQTAMLGEAMRSYRGFGLPGIDMLCDRREYTTAKQAQSASRQLGCPGVLSELYGVTNWDFDFRGHKLQGDWQAALGVTTRVHHLTWMSMEGEAKRDYPACIGYQSPWYQEYKYIEDHFARVNTAMTRGRARVRIGVLHPIESYWLYYGSNEKTGRFREELDEQFQNITRWLLLDGLDFDFISESLLKDMPPQEGKQFCVGSMSYDVIVAPAMKTIRGETLDRLEAFHDAGGQVLFVGEVPAYVDASLSDRARHLAETCTTIAFTRSQILTTLSPWREVELVSISGFDSPAGPCEPGMHTNHLLHQYREDADGSRWLFVAQGFRMQDPDQPKAETVELTVDGNWSMTWYDTLTGDITPLSAHRSEGKTKIRFEIFEHDSLLLHLVPAEEGGACPVPLVCLHPTVDTSDPIPVPDRVPVRLSEPNVLLLDMAEYRLDDGTWMPREEILRIDRNVRSCLHFPLRGSKSYQPYHLAARKRTDEPVHRLSLRFHIQSDVLLTETRLAMENRKGSTVFFDDTPVPTDSPCGFYTDESIQTIPLPPIEPGEHRLTVMLPFEATTDLEWYYLIGDFGVSVKGVQCRLTGPVRELSFGDWTKQGLPFYGGNVTYQIPLSLPKEAELAIVATQYRSPLIKIEKPVPFSPYVTTIHRLEGNPPRDESTVDITVYGSRINTFGQVHNCNKTMTWFGADSWRTEGSAWSYEYHLHPAGLLKRPEIYRLRNKEIS